MINLFKKSIVAGDDNVSTVAIAYARILDLPVSENGMPRSIDQHPDHPSLLAVYDAFSKLGAEVYAAQIDGDRLNEIKQPFIVQIESDTYHGYC